MKFLPACPERVLTIDCLEVVQLLRSYTGLVLCFLGIVDGTWERIPTAALSPRPARSMWLSIKMDRVIQYRERVQ